MGAPPGPSGLPRPVERQRLLSHQGGSGLLGPPPRAGPRDLLDPQPHRRLQPALLLLLRAHRPRHLVGARRLWAAAGRGPPGRGHVRLLALPDEPGEPPANPSRGLGPAHPVELRPAARPADGEQGRSLPPLLYPEPDGWLLPGLHDPPPAPRPPRQSRRGGRPRAPAAGRSQGPGAGRAPRGGRGGGPLPPLHPALQERRGAGRARGREQRRRVPELPDSGAGEPLLPLERTRPLGPPPPAALAEAPRALGERALPRLPAHPLRDRGVRGLLATAPAAPAGEAARRPPEPGPRRPPGPRPPRLRAGRRLHPEARRRQPALPLAPLGEPSDLDRARRHLPGEPRPLGLPAPEVARRGAPQLGRHGPLGARSRPCRDALVPPLARDRLPPPDAGGAGDERHAGAGALRRLLRGDRGLVRRPWPGAHPRRDRPVRRPRSRPGRPLARPLRRAFAPSLRLGRDPARGGLPRRL